MKFYVIIFFTSIIQLAAQNTNRSNNNCLYYLYIITQNPTSNLTPNNYFKLGECYRKSGKEKQAIIVFKKIINSYYFVWGYLSNNPKEHRWHNYKHIASINLQHIYEKQMDYKNALKYYTLARNVFREYIDCGNGRYLIDVKERITYGELYLKNDNFEKAKEHILYYAFEDDIFNDKYKKLIIKLLSKNKYLFTLLGKSLAKIFPIESKYEYYPTVFHINF